MADRVCHRLVVFGVVQGVGFRPFAYSLARRLGPAGPVANTSDGVIIEVEGDPAMLSEFARRLVSEAPAMARIDGLTRAACATVGGTEFMIIESRTGPVRTLVSPDVATCDDCLAELADPTDCRYRHPFISCTNCGPRFTIITDLPYDRPATTMRSPVVRDLRRRVRRLEFGTKMISDSAALHPLVAAMITVCPDLHVLRDPTRGGLGTSLNEIAKTAGVGVRLVERAIPVPPDVVNACAILGLDPLFVANEGKLVALGPRDQADAVLEAMRSHPLGTDAAIIGECVPEHPGLLVAGTTFGGTRAAGMPIGEQVPRIC